MTSETGTAQTHSVPSVGALHYGGRKSVFLTSNRSDKSVFLIGEPPWEGGPERVKAPYPKSNVHTCIRFLSRVGHEKSGLNLGGPPSKAKEYMRSIVNKYREGTVKRTPGGE